MSELKACPFGCCEELQKGARNDVVRCGNEICPAGQMFVSVKVWNNRPTESALEAQLTALDKYTAGLEIRVLKGEAEVERLKDKLRSHYEVRI